MSFGLKIKSMNANNKQILKNIAGSFIVKGASMVLSLFTMPAYMRYFSDESILGIWFTLLSVINWVLFFDLGIGNGLRNKLPLALAQKNNKASKEYISSAYISIFAVAVILAAVFFAIQPKLDWNLILNIDVSKISAQTLSDSVRIVIIGILCRFVFGIINSILYAVQKSAVNNFFALVSSALILIYVQFGPDLGAEGNLIALSYVHILATNLPLIAATLMVFGRELRNAIPSIKCFNKNKAEEILRIGVILLWLQLVWLVVSSTHSFLITKFVGPKQVVEYQIYYKIFNTAASVFSLALTPIWSAVTKASAENDYMWIKKLNRILLAFSGATFAVDLIIIAVLQPLVNIWLGDKAIVVNIKYALIMSVFNTLFILHSANGSISNGLSKFKIQNIFMGLAAVLMIPLSYVFAKLTGSWIGIMLATIVSILPYEIIQPIWTSRYLSRKLKS